jgi:3-dehydroquinate synthase II
MEIWLNSNDQQNAASGIGKTVSHSGETSAKFPAGADSIELFSRADRVIGIDIYFENGKVFNEQQELIGAHIIIDDSTGQSAARALLGSVDWVVVECKDWTMIPFENIISDAHHTPTKIAAIIEQAEKIPGVAFALDIGVDALVLANDDIELWHSGCIARAQRAEMMAVTEQQFDNSDGGETRNLKSKTDCCSSNEGNSSSAMELEIVEIESIETGHVGERICIDFIGLLNKGEGVITGSSSKMMGLIHGETIESEFVPTRPFRVNAGPVHAYILMADDRTKYLSELKSGDSLKVIDFRGNTRELTVGRVKIETRPLILFKLLHQNTFRSNMFVQQAETVRLVRPNGIPLSATEAIIGDNILAKVEKMGRHVGTIIQSTVDER